MQNNSVFVVSEIGYEYNDEVYHRPHNCEDSGVPILAFRSREKAEALCAQKNIEHLATNNVGEYAYEIDEVIKDENQFTLLMQDVLGDEAGEQFIDRLNDDMYYVGRELMELIGEMSDHQRILLQECLKLRFFEVTQVELNDE